MVLFLEMAPSAALLLEQKHRMLENPGAASSSWGWQSLCQAWESLPGAGGLSWPWGGWGSLLALPSLSWLHKDSSEIGECIL